MHSDITNRTFVITGAAGGIGHATAALLHTQGANLVLWDTHEMVLQIAQRLGSSGYVLNVTDVSHVEAAFEHAVAEHGAIHAVVHTAGILRTGLFTQLPLDEQRRIIEVNLFGTVLIAKCALPYLERTGGSLILLGSSSAFYGSPEFACYGATKAGVLNFAQALRVELAPMGVHVGVVSPLFVNTSMMEGQNTNARFFQRYGVTHTPEQVAQAILHGLIRRQFLIWPGWQPQMIFWMSRYLNMAEHRLMCLLWR